METITPEILEQTVLGKKSDYVNHYTPDLLFPIPRTLQRQEFPQIETLPFAGYDIWSAFELSWLNLKGKPEVAVAELRFPCTSEHLIESKSMKLFLNSFNQTQFAHVSKVEEVITNDLSVACGSPIGVSIVPLDHANSHLAAKLNGMSLDSQDIEVTEYKVNADLLSCNDKEVSEVLCSNLLKSNCWVTGQPDWASVEIHYTGPQINHASLLRYLISYRNHNGFHEQVVERIFMDLLNVCHPSKLTVLAHYTRRGGLDISPWRSNDPEFCYQHIRTVRQ